MKNSIRHLFVLSSLSILAIFARAEQAHASAAVKFTLAQAPDAQASASTKPVPAAPAQVPVNPTIVVPKPLEGQVTEAEWRSYMEFNAKLRENPEIKTLNDEIMTLSRQMQALQGKLNVLRANAVASNPEMRKLNERITKALENAHLGKVNKN